MWYFAWMLGLPLAAIFAVMNAMWLELKEDEQVIRSGDTDDAGRGWERGTRTRRVDKGLVERMPSLLPLLLRGVVGRMTTQRKRMGRVMDAMGLKRSRRRIRRRMHRGGGRNWTTRRAIQSRWNRCERWSTRRLR